MPERVLLVDNEAMVRKGLKILLDRAGFEVLEASGGREALEILGPEMVDVVVCDIRMPGVSGLDLLDLVQGRAFYIPVVILTGLLEFETTIRAMQKGAFDYLIKPVKKDTLLVTIERALQHGCLVRENRRVAGLETLFCLTIRTLLRMMEQAPYGLEHSHRVSQYARLLADHLRLKPAEKALLEYAALLHDVGMITVDFTFPSRKGPLTERERREIQVHPTAPVFDQTLDGCGELKKAIRHHHEHYDGTGYPDRLKGESIPLLARIIAIADAFESLTSGRPFRDAISPEKAVGVMAEERGRQFDPFLLDTFTEIVLKSRSG